jgi:hypothetical protein
MELLYEFVKEVVIVFIYALKFFLKFSIVHYSSPRNKKRHYAKHGAVI